VRIPDLAVTCTPAHPGVHVTPDPVLAIEMLSISNQTETWSHIGTYCTIPMLLEILVVRSTEIAAELLRRNADGTWPERFAAVGETVELRSIGASFALESAYRHVAFPEP
jgi:hypothetical protein